MNKITCLIPCYNTEKDCKEIIEETLNYCNEIVVVNDGSTDQTLSILEALQDRYKERFHLVSYEKNRGKGEALLEGMKEALKRPIDFLVTLDSDLQHLPEEIPQIVLELEKGKDLVIGNRLFKEMPFCSKISNFIISKLLHLIYKQAPIDTQSGFRGFSHRFVEEIVKKIVGGRFETEFSILLLALREKAPLGNVQITTIYPEKRVTHFRKIRDSFRVLKVLFYHWRHL